MHLHSSGANEVPTVPPWGGSGGDPDPQGAPPLAPSVLELCIRGLAGPYPPAGEATLSSRKKKRNGNRKEHRKHLRVDAGGSFQSGGVAGGQAGGRTALSGTALCSCNCAGCHGRDGM